MTAFFRSMTGRVFSTLLVGVLVSVSLTWWFAVGERQRAISQFREARLIEQAEQLVIALDAIPADHRPQFIAATRRFGLRSELMPAGEAQTGQLALGSRMAEVLSERLGNDYRVSSLEMPENRCPPLRQRRPEFTGGTAHNQCEALQVTLRDGSLLRLTMLPSRHPPPPFYAGSIAYLMLFLLSIAVLAYLVARMATRPLKQLAHAAEVFGNNIDHPPLVQKGATEIRQATAAFNAMQARIRQNIKQRTHMLAAITHDLQTPLTRLRSRIEKVENAELRNKLIEDPSATQTMVREGLDLARSMDSTESEQLLDLDSLLDSVCSDAVEAGQKVTLDGRCELPVIARPLALRRCLTNLIDNAVKYGSSARVMVRRHYAPGRVWACIDIRDNGPGIPRDHLQKVFDPFYRLETSRSRDTGGTGLELAIARNIVEQHGGSITLANHLDGGLVVTVLLPQKPAPA